MTTKVHLTNLGPMTVTVQSVDPGKPQEPVSGVAQTLYPHDSMDVFVHGTQAILIKET